MITGIYKITAPDGKVYIGQAKVLSRREKYYKVIDNVKKHPRLYISVLEHGLENHVFEIIEQCELSMLNQRERHYQDCYDVLSESGLNCRLTTTKDKPGKMRYETTILGSLALYKREDNTIGQKAMANALRGRKKSQSEKEKRKENYLVTGNNIRDYIFNTETGIYYDSVKEAAEVINSTQDRVSKMLRGLRVNITPFIYAFPKEIKTDRPLKRVVSAFQVLKLTEGQRRRYSKDYRSYQSKLVINLETGIFYKTAKEAASSIGVSCGYMSTILSGKRRNNTPLIYA